LELEASAAASLNQNAKTRALGVYPVQPTPNPPATFCSLLAIPLVRKPLTRENAYPLHVFDSAAPGLDRRQLPVVRGERRSAARRARDLEI
jgi:hypothetical protein